jgi:hypothetical protein
LASAQTLSTALTYQGELQDAGAPANGTYDFTFRLFSDSAAGTQFGPTLCLNDQVVANGKFSVSLDFGNVFTGTRRFVEMQVRAGAAGDCSSAAGFVTILPRQEATAAPYATFAPNAGTALQATSAANATNLNNQPASFYLNAGNMTGTLSDSRLSTNVPRLNAPNTFVSAITAPSFIGNLTGSATFANSAGNADALGGFPASSYRNASNLTSGTLADGRLSSNVPFLHIANTFQSQVAAQLFVGPLSGTASNATNLNGQPSNFYRNASNLDAGTISDSRLSLNVPRLGGNNTFTGQNTFGTNTVFQGALLAGSGEIGSVSPATTTIKSRGIDAIRFLHPSRFLGPFNNFPTIVSGANFVDAGNFSAAVLSGGETNPDGTLQENRIEAGSDYSVIVGGLNNTITGIAAFVGGGEINRALASRATIGGGYQNQASGVSATIGGGFQNQAAGASGVVPGGSQNSAGGANSFAAGIGSRVRTPTESGDVDGDEGTFVWSDKSSSFGVTSTGPNQFLIRATGGVGINTNSPEAPLHVTVGSAGVVTADVNSSAVFERSGTNAISILAPAASDRGILFGSPNSAVHGGITYADSTGMTFRTGVNSTRMAIDSIGNIGAGTVGRSIDARFHAQADGGRVIKVDRFTSDGELLAWARDDAAVGAVTVAAGVVTYGALTGVHYATLEAPVDTYTLVSMTGVNSILGNKDESKRQGEKVYGVRASTRANDPAVLGVYLASLDSSDYNHTTPLAQIAAVGNSDITVVDNGTGDSIEPGDYLISSDIVGTAMKLDPAKYPVGHVFAKAAGRVDWSTVTPDAGGVKRAKVSVLFTIFTHTDPSLADRLTRLEELLGQK